MPCWWNKKYGKDSICAITQTKLRAGYNKQGEKYSIFLPCKHGFNRKALLNWILFSGSTCPLCRRKFIAEITICNENISINVKPK